jgi:hypothetical protein
MSEEKMNEPKTTSPDELAKPKKPGDVQLNEQELGEVSGGTQSRSDGGGATVGRAN